MNNSWQILSEHLPKLAFDLTLDELLNYGDGVECAVYIYVLERICLEYECNAFLL
jgi:hypothetical protein